MKRRGVGTNTQGLTMYCAGAEDGGWLMHSDQYRGLQYCFTQRPAGAGSTIYAEPSPDYFQYVDLGGPGLVPVGYGYRSVEFIVRSAITLESETGNVEERRRKLAEFDSAAVMATPANSRFNELVIEAGRLSIQNGGREARIIYEPEPCVRLLA